MKGDDLVASWIQYSMLEGESRFDHPTFDAWDSVQSLCRSDPNEASRIICLIAQQNLAEKALALLAAGPMEEVMNYDEVTFWNYVDQEDMAAICASAFAHVWTHSIPELSRQRIRNALIKGDSP